MIRARRLGPSGAATLALTVALMLSVTLGLTGCGDDAESTTTLASTSSSVATTATTTPVTTSVPSTEPPTTTTGSSTTATQPSTTTTTEQLSSAETLLPDGTIKGMGFIDRVWEADGVRYLSIDYAEMLTGEEARQAAVEAGEIGPDEDLPNDYYIRNVNPKKREFTVSETVEISTSTRWAPNDGWDAPCTWADFIGFWGPGPLPDGDSHLHAVPWWIIRDGTEVKSIQEQYIP
ncbi:MAG: hypothetical protein JXA87_03525 [Thermoleophilia bacterium]|nr:hypothetical protein [Thermoleophilia bacterium]